jgi:DNA helicase-2/ATP-dependent DNA helicase PcrA
MAIVTYTNHNRREILTKFDREHSGVPSNIDVMTWFGFLLRECARPYQRFKCADRRIESLRFVNAESARYAKETDTARYYFANEDLVYSDKIAQFALECERLSSGAVTRRLERIYTDLLIDEFQDLAGWDLEIIRLFLSSGLRVTVVGDPRQHIYKTSPSRKNRQYVGTRAVALTLAWEREGLCAVEHMSASYRCNQAICAFVNALWPEMEAMTSLQEAATGHDGVFLVGTEQVQEYIARFKPQVLRHDRRASTFGAEGINFGVAKGLQFDRVLIVSTEPIRKYLRSGALRHVEDGRSKLHVAVTRARHSVAFVFDGYSAVVPDRWMP